MMRALLPTGLLLIPALAAAQPEPLAAAEAKPAWTRQVGGDAGPHHLSARDGVLVAVTWEGEVQALDAATGARLWTAKPPTPPVADEPQVAHLAGTVTIRWPDAPALAARDARTGQPRWEAALSGPASALVACEADRAVVATHRGEGPAGPTLMAQAFDPTTGASLWSVPVDGAVVGAGGPYVFAARRSGWGRIDASLTAIRCADGAVTPVRGADRPYVRFLHAADGLVAAVYFNQGYGGQQLCAGAVDQPLDCLPTTDGEVADYPVRAALLKDGALYFSTQHTTAHNLDDSDDGWLFRVDLARRAFAWRSAPLTAGTALADAGSLIATGFGTTGIDDFFYLVDPATGARVRTVPLAKAPGVIAVDPERAYVGTYEGQVRAIKLPLSGKKPPPLAAVTPQPTAAPTAPASDDLGWTKRQVIDAHPKTGRTSGQKAPGTVLDLTFLDPAGERLAIGGNDDRVHVIDVATGRELWKSGPLGKDVDHVQACASGTFAAQIYGGALFVFEAQGKRYQQRRKIPHDGGWTFGFDYGCESVVADDYDGRFTLYDAVSGKPKASFDARGQFDRRGVRVTDRGIVVSRPEKLERIDLADLREGPSAVAELPTPGRAYEGELVQAFAINDRLWLREYCGATACTVELVQPDGAVKGVERFDTTGGVWVPSVPSTLATEPSGRWLVWHRDGLEMQIVEIGAERRSRLSAVARTMSGVPQVAFSRDGRKLAIAMAPAPWQVTILERAPGPVLSPTP